jgi:hypothetical protein
VVDRVLITSIEKVYPNKVFFLPLPMPVKISIPNTLEMKEENK